MGDYFIDVLTTEDLVLLSSGYNIIDTRCRLYAMQTVRHADYAMKTKEGLHDDPFILNDERIIIRMQ